MTNTQKNVTEEKMQSQTNEASISYVTNKKKKTWCRLLVCSLSAVIIGFVLLFIILLSTSKGQVALIKLTDKLLSSLHIEHVSGGLQQGLVLENIHYQSDGVDVLVAQARLRLDLRCLWQRKICLQDLTIHQPNITIDTALLPPSEPSQKSTAPMKRINLPISVQAEHLAVENLSLNIDEQQIKLATFKSAVNLNNEFGLTLAPTQITQLQFLQQLAPVTELDIQEKDSSSATPINWQQIEQNLQQPLLANLKEIQLPFDVHLTHIEGTNWLYQQSHDEQVLQQITIPTIQLQADASDYLVQLQQLNIESSLGNINASGTIQLNQDFAVELQINSAIKALKDQQQQLLLADSQLELQLSGALLKQTHLSLITKGGINSQLTGQVELNQAKTPFHLQFISPSFHYPATGKDPLITQNIKLVAEGNLLDYQLNLTGQVQGMTVPKSELDLAVLGGLSQAQIQQFILKTLGGQAELTGKLAWQQGIAWNNELVIKQINTAHFTPDWRALLSGKISSNGYANSEDWQIELPELSLQGRLNGQPLNLQGQMKADKNELLNIGQFALNYGHNQLQAQGKLSQHSDFTLTLDAPNLAGLLPDLTADLQGNINIKGKVLEPEVDIDLNGKNIHFRQFNLANISLNSQLTSEQQVQGNLNLNLKQFKFNDIELSSLQLNLAGNEQQHQLQLVSQGQPLALNLQATGHFDRTAQQWQGELANVKIASPIGQISNNHKIDVNYQHLDITATIAEHCWQSPNLELCFPQPLIVGGEGNIYFDIAKLNLALVNTLTKQDDLLQGQLTSKGQVSWFSDQPVALKLQLEGNKLAFKQQIDYRTFALNLNHLQLETELKQNNLSLKSDIALTNNGSLKTDIHINDIAENRQLAGSLQLNKLNLALLQQLLSRGDKLTGELNANLQFGGNLQAPLLNGDIRLDQLSLSMISLPVPITNGQVDLQFNGNHSRLQAMLESHNNNHLALSGEASWRDLERWTAEVNAKADKFELDIPGMARLRISPDVQVSVTPTLLSLSGEVNIPWARISIEQLPDSAVTVSSDEVILDKAPTAQIRLPSKREQQGMLIQSDLKINIGDDVRLEAYGLKTGLKGLLSVRQDKGNLGLYGQINLIKGRYSSFGQDLLIRKGQISFSGLPSQPLLNIEAIRNPDAMEDSSVVAGVKVVGLADSPEATIFAEPSMSQDQALSYLLTGRSLESSGDAGSSSSVGAALLGLGLAKSGKVIGGIGETFGIQDLNLGTQGIGDSSQVVVSGYITPRLQVKYGVGLFDGLAEFTLKYRLLPRLYFQSVSGVNQAFDLLYQFEF